MLRDCCLAQSFEVFDIHNVNCLPRVPSAYTDAYFCGLNISRSIMWAVQDEPYERLYDEIDAGCSGDSEVVDDELESSTVVQSLVHSSVILLQTVHRTMDTAEIRSKVCTLSSCFENGQLTL